MKVLVLGYYDRANLGDEMFKTTIPNFFPNCKLNFVCIDDFKGNIYEYQAIICGGGDIINDYFYKKISDLSRSFQGPVFAFGVGIPFPSLIRKGYLDIYDHVFVRGKTDLMKIQRRLGSNFAHYLPDLGFSLSNDRQRLTSVTKNKKIGVFLAQSIFRYKSIVYSLCRFIGEILEKHDVILYRFNTSDTEAEDDKFINREIYDSLSADYPNLKNDETVYSIDGMLDVMSKLDYAVCMRFHAHIFATISSLPFFSIYSTRKVGLYVEEDNYPWKCQIESDPSGKPIKFNHKQALEKFNELMNEDVNNIKNKLDYIKNRNKFLLDTKQPMQLLINKRKRPKMLDLIDHVDVIELYNECSDIIKNKNNYDPRDGKKDNITVELDVAKEVATKLCMDITGMPSSKYLYGTIRNIMIKPWDLKEMIKWIHKDFSENYNLSCNRIHLESYCQDAFRGVHRAGWQYVIDYMKSMNCFNGTICDMYVDLTFQWGKDALKQKGVIPYTSPWIGFVHHCPETVYTEYNTVELVKDKDFQRSLFVCKGIICLSDYLANWFKVELEKIGYGHIPVHSLKHPTIIPELRFSPEKFKSNENKKLINVGAWYRNPFSIHQINPTKNFEKCSLKGKEMDNYFCPDGLILSKENILNNNSKNKWIYYMIEYIKTLGITDKLPPFEIEIFKDEVITDKTLAALKAHLTDLKKSVKTLAFLENEEYDKVFSENVVFLNLVDASAANTIIECIVRHTPVLVNKIPPVVEYLGEDYPLYYIEFKDIEKVLTVENVLKANEYLEKKNKNFLTIEYFINSFREDSIYKTLLDV